MARVLKAPGRFGGISSVVDETAPGLALELEDAAGCIQEGRNTFSFSCGCVCGSFGDKLFFSNGSLGDIRFFFGGNLSRCPYGYTFHMLEVLMLIKVKIDKSLANYTSESVKITKFLGQATCAPLAS